LLEHGCDLPQKPFPGIQGTTDSMCPEVIPTP
jgi:hypothetical protein